MFLQIKHLALGGAPRNTKEACKGPLSWIYLQHHLCMDAPPRPDRLPAPPPAPSPRSPHSHMLWAGHSTLLSTPRNTDNLNMLILIHRRPGLLHIPHCHLAKSPHWLRPVQVSFSLKENLLQFLWTELVFSHLPPHRTLSCPTCSTHQVKCCALLCVCHMLVKDRAMSVPWPHHLMQHLSLRGQMNKLAEIKPEAYHLLCANT